MRTEIIKAQIAGQPFAMMPKSMDMYLEALNNKAPHIESVEKVANNSVEYETIKSVAIISVDGALWKKQISGACGETVASYSAIIKHIDTAEADENIKTILFIVDTPGGSVAGVDEVGDRIYTSSKKTVTLYVNVGASAGIWAFTASDEVYATPVTILGSIGVVVTYLEDKEQEAKIVTITSKNADNKRCKIGEDCQAKIKTTINKYEDEFFARVERNTGFTSEQIVSTFNNGDTIFAEEAKEAGFIKDVISIKSLVEVLTSDQMGSTTSTAMPVKLAKNKTQGVIMEMTAEEIDAMQSLNAALLANKGTLETRVKTANIKLEDKGADLSALTANFDEKLSKATAKARTDASATAVASATAIVAQAFETGVATQATITAMLQAGTPKAAATVALAAQPSSQAIGQQENNLDAGTESSWAGIEFNSKD